MQSSATASTSSLSIFARLLIAFSLGLPVGFVTTFTEPSVQAPGIYGVWQVPVVVLVVAALLSIVLDLKVRRGVVSPGRVVLGIVGVLLLSGIVIIGEIVLLGALQDPNANQNLNFLNILLIPLLVALATAFTVGSNGTWKLALVSGLVSWFGAGLHFVAIALIDYIVYEQRLPGGDGGLGLPLAIAGVLIGFLLAAPGGLLGRLMRKGLLGE